MRYWKLFASALSLIGVLVAVAQEGSGGCPACIVIQSQQRSDVEVGFAELTVPKEQLNWFTIGSPASDENRFRTFIRRASRSGSIWGSATRTTASARHSR